MSNDIVNKVITTYDNKFLNERRQPITSQEGNGTGLPMESYSLGPMATGECWGTYVSTKDDVTCLLLTVSSRFTPRLVGKPAPAPLTEQNSIFKEVRCDYCF
jgi:hypothetical protein